MKNIIFGITVLITLTNCSFANDFTSSDCIKTRAAFDIGSGTTKMKVAKVDICKQIILDILLEKNIPVAYKQSLQNSKEKRFDPTIMASGLKAIQELKAFAEKFNPDSYHAVATSAYRTSINARELAKNILNATGIRIKTISQEIEAKIGFAAAATIADKELKDVVVWDIGGGSMQITTYNAHGEFVIYQGKHAAVTFKDSIITEIQKKSIQQTKTPNPLSLKHSHQAVQLAKSMAEEEVSVMLKEKIQNGAQVLGIGGVHFHSLKKQIKSKSTTYTKEQVEDALNKRAGMTDKEVGGKYASTEISNLALVTGFMKGLKIQRVKTGRINLADGLLVAPDFAK